MRDALAFIVATLTACTPPHPALSATHCSILSSALPNATDLAGHGIEYHIYDSIGADIALAMPGELLEGTFIDGIAESACISTDDTDENCLESVPRFQIEASDWPKNLVSITGGSVSDCNQIDRSLNITSDPQATYDDIRSVGDRNSYLAIIERLVVSKNGEFAIVSIAEYCGDECGHGYSLLLEKTGLTWVELGHQGHWVS